MPRTADQRYPRSGKPWTEDEEASVRRRYAQAESVDHIARRVGRSRGAVVARLVRVGAVTAEQAERILGRAGFLLKSGSGIEKTLRHTQEMVRLHQETSFVSDELGDTAVQQKRFHEVYRRQIRDFHAMQQKLETRLEQAARAGPEQARSNATP